MEHLWSPAGATSGNQRQMGCPRKLRKQAKSVAVGCHRLPGPQNGKEGVDGSSPSEGLYEVPANRPLCCCLSVERADTFRTHLRYPRRTATSRGYSRHGAATGHRARLETKALLKSALRCPSRREHDHLSPKEGVRQRVAERPCCLIVRIGWASETLSPGRGAQKRHSRRLATHRSRLDPLVLQEKPCRECPPVYARDAQKHGKEGGRRFESVRGLQVSPA
jgi:hypothetical protein